MAADKGPGGGSQRAAHWRGNGADGSAYGTPGDRAGCRPLRALFCPGRFIVIAAQRKLMMSSRRIDIERTNMVFRKSCADHFYNDVLHLLLLLGAAGGGRGRGGRARGGRGDF